MMLRFIPLLLLLALTAFSQVGAASKGIVIDGSTTVGPIAKSFAAYFTKTTGTPVTVSESGSGNGAKSLINGTCDIAAMSRKMKEKEVAAARKMGVEPVEHIVAMDGIAMIVHPANPVRTLTKEQIASIYQGRLTSWAQVGGPNRPIVVIQRESNSGTQASFKELVVGKAVPIMQRVETQASNGAVKNRVASTPMAIGFIGMGFVDRSVKTLAVDGVVPTVQSIKDGSYKLARPLFMYTNGQPQGAVKQFLALPSTPAGKRMISELGFIGR